VLDTLLKENTHVVIRDSTLSDVAFLKSRLRQTDIDEIWASNNLTPAEALTFSYYLSKVCLTVVYGEPVGMFGIVADPERYGRALIWMLGSERLEKAARHVLRQTKDIIDGFMDEYPLLYNYIDARNKKSIRWLRHLGAEINPALPHGKAGLPFHFFKFERNIIHA
jgi:hypothetical protein